MPSNDFDFFGNKSHFKVGFDVQITEVMRLPRKPFLMPKLINVFKFLLIIGIPAYICTTVLYVHIYLANMTYFAFYLSSVLKCSEAEKYFIKENPSHHVLPAFITTLYSFRNVSLTLYPL